MRSPNASYSREPNAFLVAARSACCDACVGGVQIPTTVITVYQVRRTLYSTQHSTRVCLVAIWQFKCFSWVGRSRPASSSIVSHKTPCRRYLRALSWSTRACTCLYEAAMTSRIAPARCGWCYVHASNFELQQQ